MLKPFSKLILFCLMSTALVLSADMMPIAGDGGLLCQQDDWCTDSGCQAAHGVCAAFTATSPCFCAFAN
jgi:hypothetical protein